MTRASTVIDCHEQGVHVASDCLNGGESISNCQNERHRVEKTCVFK